MNVGAKTKRQVVTLADPSTHAPLMLGVSGLRGIVGQSLTPMVVARYAAAFGRWLTDQPSDPYASEPRRVVIGRDSRPSGHTLEHAAAAGLISAGCRVTHLGIATTPGVALMTRRLGAAGGMVVTASHNPIQWNGIKLITRDGEAPPPDQVEQIIRIFETDVAQTVDLHAQQDVEHDDSAAVTHVRCILDHVDRDAIGRRKLRVVLDSVHGAGGPSTAMLLGDLGVEVMHLFAEPTGRFPHPPEPTRQHLTQLCDAVCDHDADLGFAQDPDADRLAIVDETGAYIGEEYTLALCCLHLLTRTGGGIGEARAVVANLSTSRMVDDIAAAHGAGVIRTPVGEAHVAAAMRRHDAVIGGEGNGGVIFAGVGLVRDSLASIGLILEMIAQRDRPVSRLAVEIPSYTIIKEKAAFGGAVSAESLTTDGIASMICAQFPDQKIDTQDGVRVDFPDRWVHVRPSNTEPILRIVAEAHNESDAREMIRRVRRSLGLDPA